MNSINYSIECDGNEGKYFLSFESPFGSINNIGFKVAEGERVAVKAIECLTDNLSLLAKVFNETCDADLNIIKATIHTIEDALSDASDVFDKINDGTAKAEDIELLNEHSDKLRKASNALNEIENYSTQEDLDEVELEIDYMTSDLKEFYDALINSPEEKYKDVVEQSGLIPFNEHIWQSIDPIEALKTILGDNVL